MSKLIKEIKKLCQEEGIEFTDFLKKINCPDRAVSQIGSDISESDK